MMVEKKKDDGSHSMWNRKKTQGRRRTRRILKMLPPPQWIDAKMASLEDCSKLCLIYNANDFDALEQGPVGISNLMCLTDYRAPLLLPPYPGWKQFGFMVFQEEDVVVPELGTLLSIRWLFALEWRQERSAWDALLFSLDHIRLNSLALPPLYILPALFVACMADRSAQAASNVTLASWGPVLEETCKELESFLFALYECWIDGPSTSAFRYRQFAERIPADSANYQHLIDHFTDFIGTKTLETIRCTEHLEATIIRQLSQVSVHLWTKRFLPFYEQEIPKFLSSSHLHALLPLALWQSPLSVNLGLDVVQLHSLDDVFHLWKQYMGIS